MSTATIAAITGSALSDDHDSRVELVADAFPPHSEAATAEHGFLVAPSTDIP